MPSESTIFSLEIDINLTCLKGKPRNMLSLPILLHPHCTHTSRVISVHRIFPIFLGNVLLFHLPKLIIFPVGMNIWIEVKTIQIKIVDIAGCPPKLMLFHRF